MARISPRGLFTGLGSFLAPSVVTQFVSFVTFFVYGGHRVHDLPPKSQD